MTLMGHYQYLFITFSLQIIIENHFSKIPTFWGDIPKLGILKAHDGKFRLTLFYFLISFSFV